MIGTSVVSSKGSEEQGMVLRVSYTLNQPSEVGALIANGVQIPVPLPTKANDTSEDDRVLSAY